MELVRDPIELGTDSFDAASLDLSSSAIATSSLPHSDGSREVDSKIVGQPDSPIASQIVRQRDPLIDSSLTDRSSSLSSPFTRISAQTAVISATLTSSPTDTTSQIVRDQISSIDADAGSISSLSRVGADGPDAAARSLTITVSSPSKDAVFSPTGELFSPNGELSSPQGDVNDLSCDDPRDDLKNDSVCSNASEIAPTATSTPSQQGDNNNPEVNESLCLSPPGSEPPASDPRSALPGASAETTTSTTASTTSFATTSTASSLITRQSPARRGSSPVAVLAPTFLTVLSPSHIPPPYSSSLSSSDPLKADDISSKLSPRTAKTNTVSSTAKTKFNASKTIVTEASSSSSAGTQFFLDLDQVELSRISTAEAKYVKSVKTTQGTSDSGKTEPNVTAKMSANPERNLTSLSKSAPTSNLSPGHRRTKSDGVSGGGGLRPAAANVIMTTTTPATGGDSVVVNCLGVRPSLTSHPRKDSSKPPPMPMSSPSETRKMMTTSNDLVDNNPTSSGPAIIDIFSPDCRQLRDGEDSGLTSSMSASPPKPTVENNNNNDAGYEDDDEEEGGRTSAGTDAAVVGKSGGEDHRQNGLQSRPSWSSRVSSQTCQDGVGGVSVSMAPAETPSRSISSTSFPSSSSNLLPLKSSKKSWYSALTPTYKTRSEEFIRHFKKGMLPDEKLIVDYSCALQKDILVHGRLYVSQNRICFHAKIMGWVTLLTIPCKDVTAMTKEKTARVIPNAIQINVTSESGSSGSSGNAKQDRYFFTSFSARDKTYLMLFRVWQNALLDQPMSLQELWQWVHFCYGEELGLTAEDSDYVPSEPSNCGVGSSGGGGSRRSGSRGRKKLLSLNSTAVVGSFNEGSFASSLSFSGSVTDEDVVAKKLGGGGEGGSGGSGGGVAGVRMIKYSPPVDKAVDAMDNASFSCVSTSEGGVSEDGGGGGNMKPTSAASCSDEITPERPPRKPRAGTRSNSDTDGGSIKRDATIKAKKDAGGGAIKAEFYAGSEPDSRKKDGVVNVKSSGAERSRRQSGAGSPRKKGTSAATAGVSNAEKISPVSKDIKEAGLTTCAQPAVPSSKVRGASSRSSPQHWSSSGRARPETQASAAATGGGAGSAAPSLQLGDTSGEEAEDIDDGHDRPESFCPCTSHLPILALNKVIDMSVDQLHSLLFIDNQWHDDFIVFSKRTDYSATHWTLEGENSPASGSDPSPAAVAMSGGNRKRILTYVVHLKPTIGPKTCNATETQSEFGYSVPGDIYVINSEVKNSGIPYGDNFFIHSRYCLTRVSKRQCRIRVTSEVRYTKSVWGLVKNMIEKNSIQGLDDHYSLLGQELTKEATRLAKLRQTSKEKAASNAQDNKGNPVAKRRTRRMKPRSSRDSIGDGTASAIQDPNQDQHDSTVTAVCDNASNPTVGPPRRHHHHHPSLQPNSSVGDPSSSSSPTSSTLPLHFQAESGAGLWTCFKLLIVTFAILLFFNALLFFRVKELENRKVNFDSYDIETDIDSLMDGVGAGKTETSNPEVWVKLMRKQQKLHDLELEKWHRVLDSTMEVMSLMQESLRVLHQSVGSQRRKPKGKRGDDGSGDSDSSSDSSSVIGDETLEDAVKGIHAAAAKSAAADGHRLGGAADLKQQERTTMELTAAQKLRTALKSEL